MTNEQNEKTYPVIQLGRYEVDFWQRTFLAYGLQGADEAVRLLQERTEKQRDEDRAFMAKMNSTSGACSGAQQQQGKSS